MKRCTSCGQIVAQSITTCPACGSHLVEGMKHIDEYRILNIIHEGRSSLVCKAVKEEGVRPVTIRLFTDQSGVNDIIARRLEAELKELAKLPSDYFVQHYAIKKSATGHWYRVSEWVEADNWGQIFISGMLNGQRQMVTLFHNIASALAVLHSHDHFMPYLILEDILIPKDTTRNLGVKINYKLSRFLDARATHHGPMLKKLLNCHPDILNERAIDFRTGIWSLGKIFIELLSADHNLVDFSSRVNQLKKLDPELKVLIKVMLSDDPDLRPQTMAQVVSALSRILNQMPRGTIFPPGTRKKPKLLRELTWSKRVVILLLIVIAVMVAVNTIPLFHRDAGQDKPETAFSNFIDTYADSIGFLMVEYWLADANKVVYKNRVEGTAFLVDKQGYILTNRHVACPWLEDTTLFQIYNQYKRVEKNLEFNHRMFFWFEGKKAFNRLPGLKSSHELADSYYLATAFHSDGKPNLRIAGVPRAPQKTGERIHSPFKNDFAVLKIDGVPENLSPLPLEPDPDTAEVQRLSPVIILGFPLGNSTQGDHINASITRGHVRRSTKELIQVDSSIYKGNSGGPAVNARGRVIGIASGVVTDQPTGYVPIQTPLSDFGLILPISRPAQFVRDLKAGQPKWNGILDFTLESKLKQIIDLALAHNYSKAAALTDTLLETSKDPQVFYTAAMLHFCTNDLNTSRHLFSQLISIDPESTTAKLMLHIIDWIRDQDESRAVTKELATMNWQHPDEFSGYLARILTTGANSVPGFADFENQAEKAWRLFIQGLMMEKTNQPDTAMTYYKDAVLVAAANDYLYFLAFARYEDLMEKQTAFEKDTPEHPSNHQVQKIAFRKKAKENREQVTEKYAAAATLINRFESRETSHEDKIKAYEALLGLMPDNRTIIGRVAFFHAMNAEWEKAMAFIDLYASAPCRETALSLSLELLKGEILQITTGPEAAKAYLADFGSRTQAPWYGIISKHLAQDNPGQDLVKLAGHTPEKLITLHTALGLWAEGRKDKDGAAHHYREALSTY
ncbi:MAG: trypsin-like peptidase domain-containing protein, partial [Proteobacteria bacterium]|nr:trypsin-like peptidase domain-containing protein [Pseudomonadota bacterium]